LARYDMVFFPSGGESCGHVITEALAVGTPVLTSTDTPWRELEKKGLGWDLSLDDPAAFVRCLEEFVELDPAGRA
jgi:glycosyltransferase involved in cell wall biosynthesis